MHRKILFSFLALATSFSTDGAQALETNMGYPDEPQLETEFEYNGHQVYEDESWLDEETVFNHLVDATDLADGENQHPALQAGEHPMLTVDRFCSASNTVDNVCTIKDKTLRFTADLLYKTELSLVFDNTKIKCLTIRYSPCSFMFSLEGDASTYMELKNGSYITGKQVIIGAANNEVKIGADSSIWASGQSIVSSGTQAPGIGATFIGQGGFCRDEDKNIPDSYSMDSQTVYGYFANLPASKDLSNYDNEIGSIGKANDVETAGGGRIVIYADSVTFEGEGAKIQANARPYSDFTARRYSLPGGSGGYIYVKTTNANKENSFSADSTIEARGGYAIGDNTSGSGGVILFDGGFNFSSDQVFANGGVAQRTDESGCANGAAGTVYRVEDDSLVIDNKDIKVESSTVVSIPEFRQHESAKGLSELAKVLTVTGKANLVIRGEHFGLTFDTLSAYSESRIEFGQQEDEVHIRFLQNAHIAKDAMLDFLKTKKVFIYQGVIAGTDYSKCITTIGTVYFSEFFAVQGHNVNIIGDIKVPESLSQPQKEKSIFAVESDHLKIWEDVEIYAGFTLLQGNTTVEMHPGSKLKSAHLNTCNYVHDDADMFTCMDKNEKESESLDYGNMVARFQQQFPTYGNFGKSQMIFENIWGGLRSNYSAYIISMRTVNLMGARLEGPRLGICGSDAKIQDTTIDTSGHGCPSDWGFGRGLKYATCAGSGGANGGRGGYGGIEDASSGHYESCKEHKPVPYTYGLAPNFEGSGGASGTQGAMLGGSGGGIVRLLVLNDLRVTNSDILANGLPGTRGEGQGSGGGAGGTINIQSRYLNGFGNIFAKGGAGSIGGGGGGAGGRLVVHFNSGFQYEAQPRQSHDWRGEYSIAAGAAGEIDTSQGYKAGGSGQQGVVYADKCFGGYSGPFCKPCESGTFKYDYSYAICKPCENKPTNAYYSMTAQSTSECAYECSSGLDPVTVNPYCQNAVELQVERYGGTVSSLVIVLGFFLTVLFVWILLISHSQWILRRGKSFRSTVYDGVLFTTDADTDASEAIIGSGNLKMNDSDIWSHSHRMYLIGENSINFPWYVPKDFPSRALNPENKDKLIRFQKSRQDVLNWTGLQKDTYAISRVLCPPLSNLIHKCFRKRHFNALQDQLYQNFDSSFWDSRNKSRTIRMSTSTTDNQLAFIDFLDYEKSKKDYIGPQLPLTLMLAGSGTFNSPYYVNFEDDALAKSIVYFHKETLKESLPLWFENLNTLLSKTSFFKLSGAAHKDLGQVIDWIEMGNKTLFHPLDTKATLYLFENSYSPMEGGTFKQRRRSFPMESVVFDAFPDLFENLIRFVKTKLMGRKSEIRLGLVFRPFNAEKKRQMLDRIRRITQHQKQNEGISGRVFEQGSTNLIFGSEEEDNADEDPYSYGKVQINKSAKEKANLGDIRRGGIMESTSDILEETNMEASEVFIYGSGSSAQQVKIIDKSKRALDISPDAVASLELALQKPRTSCKHKCLRFKAFWYGIWVMFFKHHGIPPKSGTRYQYFLGYSMFLCLDLLMTISVCFHMFQPMENWKLYGIPYFFISPGCSVLGPIMGLMACLFASSRLLKFQASVNATAVLLNYPLTLAVMIIKRDEPFYISLIVLLLLNKVCLSFFGAKVRQHLINPGYCRNVEKIEDRFNSYTHAKVIDEAGVKPGMSAAERAANLANHGPPSVGIVDSDEDDDDKDEEDDTSFGIIPKNRLEPVKDDREELNGF